MSTIAEIVEITIYKWVSFLIIFFSSQKNDRRELSIFTNAPKFPRVSHGCSVIKC